MMTFCPPRPREHDADDEQRKQDDAGWYANVE
jgi:hypothetical protein